MIKKFFSLLMLVVPLVSFAQAPKKLPLDGQKFIAEIQEEGKKKPWDPDDLVFVAGKFKAPIFADDGWGFTKAGKYEITKDSTTTDGIKIYSWVVDLVNEQDEKLAWSGTVAGEDITGTIELVNKKGKTQKTYSFTGKMKKKPSQK